MNVVDAIGSLLGLSAFASPVIWACLALEDSSSYNNQINAKRAALFSLFIARNGHK